MTLTTRILRLMHLFGMKPAWVGLLLLFILSFPAQADVWGFIDERGTGHFAAERLDDRYALFFRGNDTFDTRTGPRPAAAPEAGTPRAVTVPTGQPRLLAYFEVAPAYKSVQHVLREVSDLHRIDYELLKALIATESGFDAAAVSPKGAVGLMQLMPATASRYGVAADKRATVQQKLTDPRTNLRAGASYLSDLIKLFPGQLELALAAYNAGEGAVQRAGNRIPNFRETQNYVKTVMQLYTLLKPPATLTQSPSLSRVHMTLVPGGDGAQPAASVGVVAATAPLRPTTGRGNMISSSFPAGVAPVFAAVRDPY